MARTRQVGAVVGISKPVYLEIGYPEIPYTSLEVNGTIPRFIFQTASTAVPFGSTAWKAWGSIRA